MREPVLLVDAAKAIITLLIAFGVTLTQDQITAILGVVGIVATFGIGAWIQRALVTPIGSPVLATGTAVTTPEGAPAIVVKASPNQ
jgi:uncharacterized membrane protein